MRTRSLFAIPPLIAALALTAPADADGPGAYQPRERSSAASFADESSAIDVYNAGYALIQRAEHQEAMAAATTEQAGKNEALRTARESYEASLQKFSQAVRLDPAMHEAFTYLGYANRKLGRHEQALEAYEAALRIHPDYPHAIEYQGQAFLGLDRVDRAKFNYLRLYALNQAQAHKLLRAVRAWADEHAAAPPEGVDMAALQGWIADRERSHDPDEKLSSW